MTAAASLPAGTMLEDIAVIVLLVCGVDFDESLLHRFESGAKEVVIAAYLCSPITVLQLLMK